MLFLCIPRLSHAPRQWGPQCERWPGEQLPPPRGGGCPQPRVLRLSWGSPAGAGQGLILWPRYWGSSTCLEPLGSFMDGEMGFWGWDGRGGPGMRWGRVSFELPLLPLWLSAPLCVCAVKLFIPLLNDSIIGMHHKITFFFLMFLFKQAFFKFLKPWWNISSWGNPY